MLEIFISVNTSTPIYQQIFEQVKFLISNGQLKPGQKIPSVRDLADSLQLNPSTVARAYYCLKQEGFVTTNRRCGTVVMDSGYLFRIQKVLSNQFSAVL
jgi:GntR family transcriptional regulator